MKRYNFAEVCDAVAGVVGTVAILTHERADADTLGSAIALGEIMTVLGARVKICSPDGIPRRLAFLGVTAEEPGAGDTVISVDVPSAEQLGRYSVLLPRIAFRIDHHAKSEEYADGYVDGTAAAAGEIVYDIAKELIARGAISALTPRFYEAVYAAISSDTGCFKFSNVTPGTHLRASEILTHGIDTAELNRQLFDSHTPEEVAAMRLAYSALHSYHGGKISVITFTIDMQKESGAGVRELGGLIDIPRGICGTEAAAVLKQNEDAPDTYRVSLRSNTDLDVSAVAAKFGGGGHVRAAGASLSAKTPEEAEAAVVMALAEAIGE